MKELVSVMGEKVLGEIISRVKKSKYYSISLDSTPDAAHIVQLVLVLRNMEKIWPSGTLCNIHGKQKLRDVHCLDGIFEDI